MFEQHYGLNGSPFRLTPDQRFFYGSRGHRKAMSYLRYGLYQGEGFIVITGDVGTGKTTLVGQLFEELDNESVVAAQIGTTQIGADDAVRLIVAAFEIPTEGHEKAAYLTAFQAFLREKHKAGKRVLLVVDEAQNLPLRTLEELRMLSNFTVGGQALFQSFLVGQPQFLNVLANPDLAQLQQRVIASYRLEAMSQEETAEYIIHRLSTVGWTGRPQFAPEALAMIYRETTGVPRRINTLMNRVMLFGALDDLDLIDANAVGEVIADLRKEVHTAARRAASTPPSGLHAEGATLDAHERLYPDAPAQAGGAAEKTAAARGPGKAGGLSASVQAAVSGSGTQTRPSRSAQRAATVADILERLANIERTLKEHDTALEGLLDRVNRTIGSKDEGPASAPNTEETPANAGSHGDSEGGQPVALPIKRAVS